MKRFKIKKTVPVIDMVYTWVDGNDEKIIKEKQELLKEKNFTILEYSSIIVGLIIQCMCSGNME